MDALFDVLQPYANHNGGQLVFGPDGLLYLGIGDGGAADDPHNNGQDPTGFLGSIVRIDVSGDAGYVVPPDNPFVDARPTLPEIWAIGLRNPWRMSFDPEGRLIVGDVGQNLWEEVTVVGAGENHGWNTREAEHCFNPSTDV